MQKKLLIALAAALLAACQNASLTGDSYSRTQARQMQTVLEGTIVSVRHVKIDGSQTTGAGTVAGAALGGVAGGAVGKGYGSVAAAVVGAVAGGFIGNAIEEGV